MHGAICEKRLYLPRETADGKISQARFEIAERASRPQRRRAGKPHFADRARSRFIPHAGGELASPHGANRLDETHVRRGRRDEIDPAGGIDFQQRAAVSGMLAQAEIAFPKLDIEFAFEGFGEVHPECGEVGRASQHVLQRGESHPQRGDRARAARRDRQAQHARRALVVHVRQENTLHDDRAAFRRVRRPAQRAAVDLDHIRTAISRVNSERADRRRGRVHDASRDRAHVGVGDIAAVEVELPTELAFVDEPRGAAAHPPLHGHSERHALRKVDGLCGAFAACEQNAAGVAHEAQRARYFVRVARFQQRPRQRDVARRRSEARVEEAPGLCHAGFTARPARASSSFLHEKSELALLRIR
jgi:hypothetical protein